MFLNTPQYVDTGTFNKLFGMFAALFTEESKKHSDWPSAYSVTVICAEDVYNMKIVFRIAKIEQMKLGAGLNIVYSVGSFTAPVIAQDEMEAMVRTKAVLEEYNGTL
jgi:hypothetical protein